jgi:hypothetical protein
MGATKGTRDAVGAELESDPLDDADIHVVNINGTWPSTAPSRAIRSTWRPPPPLSVWPASGTCTITCRLCCPTKDDFGINYDADPVDVTWFVQDALHRNALVGDDSDISVDSSGNTVTLRGHVLTWAEHDAVAGAAWMAGGVMQVRDDLDITS